MSLRTIGSCSRRPFRGIMPAIAGWRLVALCLAVVLAPSAAEGAALLPPAAKIKTDRPRMLLRPKATPLAISLDQLRAIPRDADFQKMLAQLKGQKNAATQAMVYLLTGEEAAAQEAIQRMRDFKAPESADSFDVYLGLRRLALAYDWLHTYPGFSGEIKAEVRRKAAPLAAAGLRLSSDHIFHNYVWMSAGGTALWALATAGDDAEADRLWETIRGRFNEGLYPAMQYLDGCPGESMGYWALYDLSPGVLALLAAQSAFEIDLVRTVKQEQGDWLARQFDNLILGTLPDMRHVPWGDMQSGPDGGVTHEMAGVIDALAWALKSPEGVYFSRWLAAKRGLARFHSETAIFYILYTRNLGAAPAEPALAGLFGGKHGGHVLARSGWDDGATVVAFRCTDHYGGHNHYDQGSFVIYRNGLLALDAGRYRSPGGSQQKTDAHNTFLLGGQGQRRVRGQWFKTVAEFKENLAGGRRLETGDILFYKDTPAWTASAGQFAQAYPAEVVKGCVRQLLFIRPVTVVVVDHLEAPAGKVLPEVQWLLHLPAQPEVGGGYVAVSNGPSWLRCRSVWPGHAAPKVEPSLSTLVDRQKAIQAHRATFTYQGQERLTLVHLLEVGDGEVPTEVPRVKVNVTARAVEIPLAGQTFTFAAEPTFSVTEKSRP